MQDGRAHRGREGASPCFGNRPEQGAGDDERSHRRDAADADPPDRIHEVPATGAGAREAIAEALDERARLPGDDGRRAAAPGLDQRLARIADVERLAGAEKMVARIAGAGQPDSSRKDRNLATAGAQSDDMAGRKGAHGLGANRAEEGRRLLRIHHGHLCIDDAVIIVSTTGQIQ